MSGSLASIPSASEGATGEKQHALLKRKRSTFEDTTADVAEDKAVYNPTPGPSRLTIRLPKGRTARAAVPLESAPPTSPRHPSCLADVDAVVRGAAASACLEAATQASNTPPILTN